MPIAPATARSRLEEAGIRATRGRVLVLAELARERDDATAQELHGRLRERGERVGLATVYRALAALATAGIVDTLSHRRGELCYRVCRDEHHHHMVCSRCHRVIELGDCRVDEWLDRVSAEHGFVPVRHRLEVTGVCGVCR